MKVYEAFITGAQIYITKNGDLFISINDSDPKKVLHIDLPLVPIMQAKLMDCINRELLPQIGWSHTHILVGILFSQLELDRQLAPTPDIQLHEERTQAYTLSA